MQKTEIEAEINRLENRYVALKVIFSDDTMIRESLKREREVTLEKMLTLQQNLLKEVITPNTHEPLY